MPHDATFHQGLNCLLCQRIEFSLIITVNPSIHTLYNSDFVVCSFVVNSIDLNRVREFARKRFLLNAVSGVCLPTS